mgnify:CR=1 FL=1
MAGDMIYKGKVWKFGDKISTDLMMPGAQVLAGQDKSRPAHKWCFNANRPEWADQVQPGDIIVAGTNFGCGSSRNGALQLQRNGIATVIAESTSRIFLRSAVNIAMPAVWCKGVHDAFEEGDIAEVNVTTGEIKNLTKGTALQGDALPEDSPPMQILRAGGFQRYQWVCWLARQFLSSSPS